MVEEKNAKADAASKLATGKKLTNRQKRKKLNEKNKWPQHPKIQSMDKRAQAYIRVAGFGGNTKAKETIDPKLDLMSPEVKFGRLLGGTDQRKRHAAVMKLKAYLRARCDINNENGGISELDLLKLWKGLWYTLYMADKVPVQDELSKHLSELLWCVAGTEEEDEYAGQAYLDMCEEAEKALAEEEDDDGDEGDVTLEEIVNTFEDEDERDSSSDGDHDNSNSEVVSDEEENNEDDQGDENSPEEMDDHEMKEMEELDDNQIPHCRGAHLASMFIRTFFRTIRREWGKMDKYRVDKFYSLTRMYMHEIFKYMATRHWNLGIIRLFNDAIFEEVLNQTPNGLRYHLIDIVLDELAKANAEAPMPLTEATFLDTLEPYFAMCQTGAGDDTIQGRVLEKIVEKFLDNYSVISEKALNSDDQNEEEGLIFDQVHVGSVAQFIFEIASDPETKDRYRKPLYDMHKKYMRRLNKVGKDVELHENQNETEDDLAEVDDEMVDAQDGNDEPMEGESTLRSDEVLEEKGDKMETEETTVVNHSNKKEKKRKRKKKDKNKQKEDSSKLDDDVQEETVTISLSEQKQAKSRSKKKEEKPKAEDTKTHSTPEAKSQAGERKKVKFTSTNRSKSYVASMKALVTATPPKNLTPEKSILRKKLDKAAKASRKSAKHAVGKGGRKRAVNYF